MCDNRFFVCKHCGNLVGMIHNSGVPMMCCGEAMTELTPNTVDASKEKHVPVATVTDGRVDVAVGSAAHPMLEEHHIAWIYVQTENGGQRKCLKVGEEPKASFMLADDKAVAVFAYCNLHGLWKVEL